MSDVRSINEPNAPVTPLVFPSINAPEVAPRETTPYREQQVYGEAQAPRHAPRHQHNAVVDPDDLEDEIEQSVEDGDIEYR